MSKRFVYRSLEVAATRTIDLVAEPVQYIAVQTNRDLLFFLRDLNYRPALRLAEIVFALHVWFELFAFEGVAVLGLDGGGYFASEADRVDGAALAESLEYCDLRREHIALVNGGQRAARLVIDALGGIRDEHASGINHD